MHESTGPSVSRRAGLLIAALLFAVALVKGLHLASVLMPFEGWDEYQHLAVADFLDAEGRMPRPSDRVRPAMWPFLRAHPHPDGSARQVEGLGARNYAGKVWSGREWIDPEAATGFDDPPLLYQAQHGPVYYGFLVGLKHVLGLDSYLAWADAGRVANVIFGALMLVTWFLILSVVYRAEAPPLLAALVCTVVAANSLFTYNHARVANDALGNLLASVTLAVYVLAVSRATFFAGATRGLALAAGLGLLTGVTALTKGFGLALIPVFLLALPAVAWRRERRPGLALGLGAVFLAAYLAAAGWYHANCLAEHGTLTGMQDSVLNTADGRSIVSIADELPGLALRTVGRLFVFGQYNVGGWSFLGGTGSSSKWNRRAIQIGLGLLVLALLWRRSRRTELVALRARPELWLLMGALWAAILHHTFQSRLAFGLPMTNAWYAILVLPVLMLTVLLGAWSLYRPLAIVHAAVFCGVWSIAHYKSVIETMIPHQTGVEGLAEGLARIAPHHAFLHFTGPGVIGLEFALLALLFGVVVFRARKAFGDPVPWRRR
jgi:hypothetical protein